jgi:hypothetical protein
LLESVKSGTYNEQLVIELLNINDFTYFISADSFQNISGELYLEIRHRILELREVALKKATVNGKSNLPQAKKFFDQNFYSEVLNIFPLSQYEAKQIGIWDYITERVLLDIAVWRFNFDTIDDRFIGLHKARHVFARWWFRKSIAEGGEAKQIYSLNEGEWETVFERQSLCWNPSIANACLRVLQETKDNIPVSYKNSYSQKANIIWIKRIRRLTSQSILDAFHEDDLYNKFLILHPYNES